MGSTSQPQVTSQTWSSFHTTNVYAKLASEVSMYSVFVDSGTRATLGEYSGLGVNSPEPWSEEPVLNANSLPQICFSLEFRL